MPDSITEIYADEMIALSVSEDRSTVKLFFSSQRITGTGKLENIPVLSLVLPSKIAEGMLVDVNEAISQHAPNGLKN